MATHEHHHKLKTPDGLQLYTVTYTPDESPKAHLVLVHGYAEHAGRYAHVIEAIRSEGYAVYTIDHRGHGQSEGERAYFDTLAQPIDDLKQFVNNIQAANGNPPLFMLGHSMGALIALSFALQHNFELKGLILSGIPLTADLATSPVLISIAKILNIVAPKLPLADAAPINELSTDPTIARAFAADPLNWKEKMRVRMGMTMRDYARAARASNMTPLKMPLLVLHGADDKISPPSGTQWVYDHAPSTDKTIKIYPDMKHEILNEIDRASVLSDITAWLDAHI